METKTDLMEEFGEEPEKRGKLWKYLEDASYAYEKRKEEMQEFLTSLASEENVKNAQFVASFLAGVGIGVLSYFLFGKMNNKK